MDTETTGLENDAEILELVIIDYNGKSLFNHRMKPIRKRSGGKRDSTADKNVHR